MAEFSVKLNFSVFFVFQSQEQSNILNSNTKGQSRVSALYLTGP